MVAEAWLVKMGNQVSSNLKKSLLLSQTSSKNKDPCSENVKQTFGILSFEVANVMSKLVHLYKSVSQQEICKLKKEGIRLEGVKKLVSSDESFLLELACAERLDDLDRVSEMVSRLGKKCMEPALQGFEHVYDDMTSGKIEVRELGFLVKNMDGMVRKMERYIGATRNLYKELEALNALVRSTKRRHFSKTEESEKDFELKLLQKRQNVKQLESSLWNQTYDKVVELLARTVCTVYARICTAFGIDNVVLAGSVKSIEKLGSLTVERSEKKAPYIRTQFSLPSEKRALMLHCLSLTSSVSRINDNDNDNEPETRIPSSASRRQLHCPSNGSLFGPKTRLAAHVNPSTVGGSGLGLHYANVITLIEKLLCCPNLVSKGAREDLYQMLPSSLRQSLRTILKSQSKNLALCDASLARSSRETLEGILEWIAPLAHNMITWQSERNFDKQQHGGTRTDILLLQTLYFADRVKTEAAICELLVGLSYVCHYERKQPTLLSCMSGFEFGCPSLHESQIISRGSAEISIKQRLILLLLAVFGGFVVIVFVSFENTWHLFAGFWSCASLVCMFASPLFIIVPNGIGSILGILQLALYAYYINLSKGSSKEP